jgi:hypothetical protein
MAYGQQQLRPGRSSSKITPPSRPITSRIQQGKTGMEGASEDAKLDFGGMPSSGNMAPSAGSPVAPKGGSTTKSGGLESKPGATYSHASTKKPLKPGSSGSSNTGSVDTMTKLIFHPKGGMGKGKSAKTPGSAPGYKDSGSKGSAQKTGVSS